MELKASQGKIKGVIMEKVQADVIKKKKIDTKNLTENLLVIFVILCPVFEYFKFCFQDTFNTNLSPSTILRPIIPLICNYRFIYKK